MTYFEEVPFSIDTTYVIMIKIARTGSNVLEGPLSLRETHLPGVSFVQKIVSFRKKKIVI